MPHRITISPNDHERLMAIIMDERPSDLPDIDVVREAMDVPEEDGSVRIWNQPHIIEAMRSLLGGIQGHAGGDNDWTSWRYGSLLMYDRSPLLQNISDADLQTPQRMFEHLTHLSPQIAKEQNAILEKGNEGLEQYSIVTLANALSAAGRLNGDTQTIIRLAAGWETLQASPTLLAIERKDVNSPAKTIDRLAKLRPEIISDLRFARKDLSLGETELPLVKLIYAIASAGLISIDALEAYVRLAGYRDLYERSEILQTIGKSAFRDPKKLIGKIHGIRSNVLEEQRNLRNGNGHAPKSYATSTLVYALAAGLGIEGSIEAHLRLANAYDLFMRSKILRGIQADQLKDHRKLIDRLSELRHAIVREQQNVKRGKGGRKVRTYSLSTLINALAAGGRISGSTRHFGGLANSRDIFERSPTLRAIPDTAVEDDKAILLFLLACRDRIAVENLREQGRLSGDDYAFEGAEKHYALSTLIEALGAGGMIDGDFAARLMRTKAGPLEYFLARRDIAEPVVKRTLDFDGRKKKPGVLNLLNRADFTWLNDPDKTLSDPYIRSIMMMGRWFLKEPHAVTKSLYDAPDIMFAATLPIFNPGMGAKSYDEMARRLSLKVLEGGGRSGNMGLRLMPDKASRMMAEATEASELRPDTAREHALTAVKMIVDHNSGMNDDLSEIRKTYVANLQLIYDLNASPALSSSMMLQAGALSTFALA